MLRRKVLQIDFMLPLESFFDITLADPLTSLVDEPRVIIDRCKPFRLLLFAQPKDNFSFDGVEVHAIPRRIQGGAVDLLARKPWSTSSLVSRIDLIDEDGNVVARWFEQTTVVTGERWRLTMALHPDTDRRIQPWCW